MAAKTKVEARAFNAFLDAVKYQLEVGPAAKMFRFLDGDGVVFTPAWVVATSELRATLAYIHHAGLKPTRIYASDIAAEFVRSEEMKRDVPVE